MNRRVVDHVVAVAYGIVCFAVVVAPAIAVRRAHVLGGFGDIEGVDLIIASTLIGGAHGIGAAVRLRNEERTAVRRGDMWIAALNSLVVLGLGASLLLVAVLNRYADEHASMADRGYPVVALWAGLQLVAVALAEGTGRLVFWWLEPHEPTHIVEHVLHPFHHADGNEPPVGPATPPPSPS